MKGSKALPQRLIDALNDRIAGGKMGGVELTPPVDERISDIVRRIVVVGRKCSHPAALPPVARV